MSVIQNNLLMTPEGYQISRSVRLRSSAGGFFNRTPASSGNRKTFTWSGWVKRGVLASGDHPIISALTDANNRMFFFWDASDVLRFFFAVGGTTYEAYTSAVYRDPSAYYHFVIACDTTQATASNRLKVFVNNVQLTLNGTFVPQNTDTQWNNSVAHYLGKKDTSGVYFDGLHTEQNNIDGQALTPSSFGEYNAITGVWQPKKYGGTYGTNGFYLNFSDPSAATAAAIGKDYSGNGNNWTPNNISVTAGATYDSMLDVPTMWADGGNGRGNYAVLNAVIPWGATVGATLTEGNSKLTSTSGAGARGFGTMGMTSGKWYWEAQWTAGANPNLGSGIVKEPISLVELIGYDANSWGYYCTSGGYGIWNNGTRTAVGSAFTANSDILGVAFDADAGSLYFYKNGTLIGAGASFTGLTGTTFYPAISANASTSVINFGQRPFAYTPPTGFKALNTQNLPDSTIKKGNKYFDATTYTGTGSAQSIVNSGAMQPDLVWIKNRNNTDFHRLTDSVRGAALSLRSDATTAEQTTNSITSFNSNGFSVGTENTSTYTYVGWQWKKGATQGFDIVTYTGTGVARTVAHSLGVAPKMYIVKQRSGVSNWETYHTSLGSGYYVVLDGTNAKINSTVVWNNTAPTSTVFSLGTGGNNTSGQTYVAYLFAEVAGYSKFGSYTGNGSADGPFVYCGFRPRFVLIKRSDAGAENWWILDTSRDPYNTLGNALFPNNSGAESAGYTFDFLSNGFKLRTYINTSGGTYIYAAFAENPFKNSLAR